jgi:tripartite-type tricarboxylate transporter receptor subunit TctC
MRIGAYLACALNLLCAAAGAAVADPVADFYHGRPLYFVVGSAAGGGYDVYARLLSRFLVRHIAGRPVAVIQNMPGASSLVMANHLYNVAARDGSVLGFANREVFFEPLWHNPQARFDGRRFTWVGSMNKDVATCVAWFTSGVHTLEETREREMLLGSTSPTSSGTTLPKLLNGVLGTRFRLVLGYEAVDRIGIAMENGEVEGTCGATWANIKSARRDWLDHGKITVIAQLALTKHPELPDVPLAIAAARNDSERQALDLVFAPQAMGRPVAAPPGVPKDRVAALRAAFEATMVDADFVAAAAQEAIEITPMSGAEVGATVDRLDAVPGPVVQRVKELIGAGSGG